MGLLRGMARTAVVAGTATAVSNRVARRQAGRWADQEALEAMRQAPPAPVAAPVAPPAPVAAPAAPVAPPPPPAAPAAGDADATIARLQKLGELLAAGVLTQEEFAAQKALILGL